MKKTLIIMVLLVFAIFAGALKADVLIKQSTTIETIGMPPADISAEIKIKGDKSYIKSKGDAPKMGIPSGAMGKDLNIITRLDKGILWNLNSAGKSYTVENLEDMKAALENPEAAIALTTPEKYDWTMNVTEMGEATINGLKCTGLKGIVTGLSIKNLTEKSRITYEIWVGSDIPGKDEIQAHYKKLSEFSGQDQFMNRQLLNRIFGNVGDEFAKMNEAVKKLDGYPIRMSITVEMALGGDGNDPHAAAMMQQFQSLGAKTAEDGMMTVTSFTTNVTSVEAASFGDSVFEVPEGFTETK